MSDAVSVAKTYLGLIDGMYVWEVVDTATGTVIGYDSKAVESDEPTE